MGADRDRGRRPPGAGLSLLAARARRVRDRLGHSAHRLRDPAADAGVESRGDDGSGTLRAAERFHGGPALAAVLRRLLRARTQIPITCYLVRTSNAVILFDTGVPPRAVPG